MLVAPAVFEPDDDGYSQVIADAPEADVRRDAQRAALNCPTGAIVVDEPVTPTS
jgi:ferredoxin